MHDTLLLLHILGAAGWIGGGMYLYFIIPRLAKRRTEGASALNEISESADKFFGLVAGLVLLTGIGLVLNSDAYGWSDAFVWVGIGVFLASGAWQPLVGAKTEERLLAAVSGDAGDLEGAIASWRRAGVFDLAIVLVALWAMVTKVGT